MRGVSTLHDKLFLHTFLIYIGTLKIYLVSVNVFNVPNYLTLWNWENNSNGFKWCMKMWKEGIAEGDGNTVKDLEFGVK